MSRRRTAKFASIVSRCGFLTNGVNGSKSHCTERCARSSFDVGRHDGFRLAAEIFREDDRFRQDPSSVGEGGGFRSEDARYDFFFGKFIAVLQDAFSALYELARFQLALHFLRLFEKPGILFSQNTARDRAAHLLSNKGNETDLVGRVLVRLAMVDVDDADDIAPADQRDRQEGLDKCLRPGPEIA